jgi:hypothetical protein
MTADDLPRTHRSQLYVASGARDAVNDLIADKDVVIA